MLPIHDLNTADGKAALDATLARLRDTASMTGDAARTVAGILEDVAQRGDAAVVEYMQRWTDPGFSAQRIRVTDEDLAAAEAALSAEMREALRASIANVTAYQQHVMPREHEPITIDGAELGLRFMPVQSAGCYVPGGTAVLFSTMIMTAVPALVAGVPREKVAVVCPPPTRRDESQPAGDVSPLVLATAKLLGIEQVYRLGGAQAVAALAYGTESVEKVDLIAGPGNIFVQLAKAQLGAVCGTDNGFYGPSEIVTVADETARAANVAADLIAQAEHNPGKCFLVSWSRPVIDTIVAEVERQLAQRGRSDAIVAALREESCAVVVKDEAEAAEVADRFAGEHVNLAVAEPKAWLARLKHGGEFFLGDQTPVAAGDYYAGPSHCLPTGTTARFASGISVYTFLRRSGTVAYPHGLPAHAIERIARLAEAEGLDGHAASARQRG
jgi:histidinol dehydrogenase